MADTSLHDPTLDGLVKLEGKLSNIKNFYTPNLLQTLNIERKEEMHSRMLAWLFDSEKNAEKGIHAVEKLLVAVKEIKDPNGQYFQRENNDSNNSGIVANKVVDEKIIQTTVATESVISNGRVDLKISIITKKKNAYFIILENKVDASESNKQTERYYRYYGKQEQNSIFLYLTPLPESQLIDLKEPECESNAFIQVNYQILFDKVLKGIKFQGGNNIMIDQYMKTLLTLDHKNRMNKIRRSLSMAEDKRMINKSYDIWKKYRNDIVYILKIGLDQNNPELFDEIMKLNLHNTRDNTKFTLKYKDNPNNEEIPEELGKGKLVFFVMKHFLKMAGNGNINIALELLSSEEINNKKYNPKHRYDWVISKEEYDGKIQDENSTIMNRYQSDTIDIDNDHYYVCSEWGIDNIKALFLFIKDNPEYFKDILIKNDNKKRNDLTWDYDNQQCYDRE